MLCYHNFGTSVILSLVPLVPLVEQELHTLPEHLNSTPVLAGFVSLDL
jgi:hypothetical protein